MRISRGWIPVSLLGFFAFLPYHAFAAQSSFFGPIVSAECNCPGAAPDFGCVFQTVQNLMNFGISISVIIATLVIAYAAVLWITSPFSPSNREKGRTILLNAVIGLVIVLSAWLIVDFVMKALYNQGSQFGPWNTILSGGSQCFVPKPPEKIGSNLSGILGQLINSTAGGSSGGIGPKGKAQCNANNPACSVQALQSAGLSEKQAQAMSCIAMSESSGVASQYNSSSGACGTFQILSGHRSSTWNQPSAHTGSCSVNTACTDAACNLQTATIMFKQSGYQPWICPGCNAVAHQCVANFDPGHGE